MPAQLPLTGVDHIGIVVADFAPIVALFGQVPGAEIHPEEEYADLGLAIQFIAVGALRLELLRPITADGRAADIIASGRAGLHHLAFTTPDLDHALTTARAHGIGLADHVGRAGAHGSTIAFLDAAALSGMAVELVQPRSDPS